MNKERLAAFFLFSIPNEIEQSFQWPVIFFTETDYGDHIYKNLNQINQVLEENSTSTDMIDIVRSFHYEWLQAVEDVESFKKRLQDIPHEIILKAVDFTLNCTQNRYQIISQFIKELLSNMKDEDKNVMEANLGIIYEIREIHLNALREKRENILKQIDQVEYFTHIRGEIEELLYWLDKQYDNLAFQFARELVLKKPIMPNDLINISKEIIDQVTTTPYGKSYKKGDVKYLQCKEHETIFIKSEREIQIASYNEKINRLKERISTLQDQDSLKVMTLQHKKMYFKDRVDSLQNIKHCIIKLKSKNVMNDHERIFCHMLPRQNRCQLVEQLINFWSSAIANRISETIISILSVDDFKESYSDNFGKFTVDKYGRRIYNKEDKLYQINENFELVVVDDDDKHIYYYDECGRYFLDENHERVYKAHKDASEYMLNQDGHLAKTKEIRDGIEYFYDSIGRYYINADGQKIYREDEEASEYMNDGLDNLLKIRDKFCFHKIDKKPTLNLEENKYLEREVGSALKKCIADVISHQPTDPIKYLAESLLKYRENMLKRQFYLERENLRLEACALFNEQDSMTRSNISPE